MTKIIQEGIVYVLSMLNPAGAIVQAVRAIYSGIMFFMDNAERIKDLVSAITNSIADIAAGKIGTAAKYITDSLIRTVPIVLSFLSHLLKLNKVTEVIRNAISKVSKPITKAIKKGVKWLVKKVKGWLKKAKNFFSGKKDKKGSKKVAETSGEDKARIDGEGMEDENFEYTTDVSKVKGWWKEDEEFKFENGEKHELYFEIKDGKAKLYMASDDPSPLRDKINELIKERFSDDKEKVNNEIKTNPLFKAIMGILTKLEAEIKDKDVFEQARYSGDDEAIKTERKEAKAKVKNRVGKRVTKSQPKNKKPTNLDVSKNLNKTIDGYLIKMTTLLKEAFGEFDDSSMQKSSKPKYGSPETNSNGFGMSMKVTHLTRFPFEQGTTPQDSNDIMKKLQERKTKKGSDNPFYIRGHLLNDNLGGPGVWKNMTPLTQTANKEHLKQIESKIKKGVNAGKVYHYEIKVHYGTGTINLTRSQGEEETDESFKTKTEIAKVEQHIPQGIEATYYEVEKAKDDTQDVQAKAGGDKGKMSILNTIKASPESKDYHLKSEKEGDKEEKISLGSDKEKYKSSEVATKLGISRKIAELILEHRGYKTGANLKTKVTKAMEESTRFTKTDVKNWKVDANGLTEKWYDDGKGAIKYT